MKKARYDMRTNRRKIDRWKIGKYECAAMLELSGGDLLVGMLFSCHSVSSMYRIAHRRARDRAAAKYRFQQSLKRMQTKGLIQLLEEGDQTFARLTDSGKVELGFLTLRTKRPDTWDGLWRVLMFDIPNTNSQLRDELRGLIKRIGYVSLQQSVYVFPHEVPELTALLHEKNLPLSQITHTTFTSLAHDTALRKHFKLPTSKTC